MSKLKPHHGAALVAGHPIARAIELDIAAIAGAQEKHRPIASTIETAAIDASATLKVAILRGRQLTRQSRQRDSRSSRRHSRPRLHSNRVSHSRSRSPSRASTSSSDDEWCERAAKHHKHRSQQRTKHRHRKRRRSRSTSSSTSSSNSSTSDSSSDDTSDSRNRRRRKKRKHNHSRLRLPSNTKDKLKKLAVSCCPPLQERYCARIARGEYVSFDKLLIPKGHRYPPDSDKHKHKQPGNRVTGLLLGWKHGIGSRGWCW